MRLTLARGMRAVLVPRAQADALIRRLMELGCIDRTRRIAGRGAEVVIPLAKAPPLALEPYRARLAEVEDAPDRPGVPNPQIELRRRMAEAGVPPNVVPAKWERVGDVVVLRLADPARPHAERIARVFGEVLHATTVVEDVSGVHGPLRIPEVRVLWGDGTRTVHVEGGIRFSLDVSQVMFSSGNVAERLGIAGPVGPRDVVVDLFAGIGYFTLPIAVRARPKRVYACEVNPIAFGFLQENLRLNRVENVVPILGDCREAAPTGVATWVVMGHFSAPTYLDVAVRCVRSVGTILVHVREPKERFPQDAVRRIERTAASFGVDVQAVRARRVKSYAPGIVHGVVEARIARRPKGISAPDDSLRKVVS